MSSVRSVRGGGAARDDTVTTRSAKSLTPPTSRSTPGGSGRLRDGDRADRRPRGAPHLERQAHERELVDGRGGELLQVQVFDDRDAGPNQEYQVPGQGHLELGVGPGEW